MERNQSRNRVVPLDDLDDYEVAEGDPDVRGWEVIAADGKEIGKVDDLLADATALKVRYLSIDLDRDLVSDRDHNHVLIPIGQVRLIEEDKRVMTDVMGSREIVGLPEYTGGPVTREYETTLRQRFDNSYQHGTLGEEDFYSHDLYDEERFYGRGVGAGSSSGGSRTTKRSPSDTGSSFGGNRETREVREVRPDRQSRPDRERQGREGRGEGVHPEDRPGRSGPAPDRDRDR